MPHKPPINPVRWTPPPVDTLPDFPSAELTIVPMPGDAPEDVVVGADGSLWTGLVDGRIVRVSADGDTDVVADTGGRPLGLHVARDGRLLVCDSYRGLLSLDPGTGALEVLVPDIDGRPLRFCSNVTETEDGTIYFTESTSSFHYEHFRAAILEARGDGGLYKLATDGTVSTLREGLYFANGVTVTADGTALVFAETQGRRLSKYWRPGRRPAASRRSRSTCPACPTTSRRAPTDESGSRSSPRSMPLPSGSRRGRPSCASWCGVCRTRCSRRWPWRCGPSPSIPTAAPRSRACVAGTASSDR